jgi:hypothetical protein
MYSPKQLPISTSERFHESILLMFHMCSRINVGTYTFLNIRLDEPMFQLTKPSTNQKYKVARNKEKRREKNWGYQLEIQAQG